MVVTPVVLEEVIKMLLTCELDQDSWRLLIPNPVLGMYLPLTIPIARAEGRNFKDATLKKFLFRPSEHLHVQLL